MRPYASVQISSPDDPVTSAVCVPATTGRGVTVGARNGTDDGNTSNALSYLSLDALWETARTAYDTLNALFAWPPSVKVVPAVRL
jgi:hypothetical protein